MQIDVALRWAGLLGAGLASAGGTAGRDLNRPPRNGFLWLAGDHHIHGSANS